VFGCELGHPLAQEQLGYLYIRQSTLGQVNENGESTRRQYALRDRAIALGWRAQRVHIIDQDLGMSGAHSVARDGFQELVAAVGLRKVGIVLGLEVSRLARNSGRLAATAAAVCLHGYVNP
jgi:DNA invertase Pin-like site-specific DNA recombinase